MKKSLLYIFMLYGTLFSSQREKILTEEFFMQEEMPKKAHYKPQKHKETQMGSLEMALVANMSLVARNIGDELYANRYILGFVEKSDEVHFNRNNGFNFNYLELEFESKLLRVVELYSSLHLEEDEFHIDEMFVESGVPGGEFFFKAGRFRSDFSSLNALHHHERTFSYTPLVFESFFGQRGLIGDGILVQYRNEDKVSLVGGIEVMQDYYEKSLTVTGRSTLYTGYLKQTFSLSDNSSLMFGAVVIHDGDTNMKTDIYGAQMQLTFKMSESCTLESRSELLQKDMGDERGTGFYVQSIYKKEEWGMGIRYDRLLANGISEEKYPDRYTFVALYEPFGFVIFHLQYTYDQSRFIGANKEYISEALLSMSIKTGDIH